MSVFLEHRQSVFDGTRDPWLAELDARLCCMAGFEPGTGGPLRVLYLEAGAEAPPAVATDESSWRCKVSIYLNDIESAGELCLGRSACVLRPRCGTAVIAKWSGAGARDPRSEPSEMPPPTVFVILLLALLPLVAANRFYQRVLGALGWVLPMNYLMLPLGVLLFLVAAPFAIAAPAGSVRWDWLTWTVETSGGFVLATFSSTSFDIGNFTFFPGAVAHSAASSTGSER
jgi:hypothetical protein